MPKSNKQRQQEHADRQKAKDSEAWKKKNREKQARSAKKKRDLLAADPFVQKIEVAKLLCDHQNKEAQRIVKLQAAKEKHELKNELKRLDKNAKNEQKRLDENAKSAQKRLDNNVTKPGNKVRIKVANMFNRTAGWFSGASSLAEDGGSMAGFSVASSDGNDEDTSLTLPCGSLTSADDDIYAATKSTGSGFSVATSAFADDDMHEVPPHALLKPIAESHEDDNYQSFKSETSIATTKNAAPRGSLKSISEAHEDYDEAGDYLSFQFEASVATTKNTAPRRSLKSARSEFSVTPSVSEISVTSSVAEDDDDMSVAAPQGSLKSIVEGEYRQAPFQSEQPTATTEVVTLPLTEQEWEFRLNEEEGLVVATVGQKLIWQAVETLVPGIEPKDGLGNVLCQLLRSGRYQIVHPNGAPCDPLLKKDLWYICDQRNYVHHLKWGFVVRDLPQFIFRLRRALEALCPNWRLIHFNAGEQRALSQLNERAQQYDRYVENRDNR